MFNCEGCEHLNNPDDGYCFMFSDRPPLCALYKSEKAPAANPDINALVRDAEACLGWMTEWIAADLCECEGAHTCGRTERIEEAGRLENDIASFRTLDKSDEAPAASSDVSTLANEIEAKIGNQELSAAQVFTQMRQLINKVRAERSCEHNGKHRGVRALRN